MADTQREKILQEIQTRLNASGKPSGTVVERFRLTPLDPVNDAASLPSIVIRVQRDEPTPATQPGRSPLVERTMTVRLECAVVATTGQTVDKALDPLLSWLTKALMNKADLVTPDFTLGALALRVEEQSTEWDGDALDQPYGRSFTEFRIRYTTKTNDQEAKV